MSDMKQGWKVKKLGDVCVKSANIKWEAHKGESLKITESSLVNSTNAPSRAKKIICSGDVLFATTRPTLRRAAIVTDEYNSQICSTGFTVLRPNTSAITTKYIHYILQSESFMDEMKKLQRGASYPAVTDGDVKGFSIPVPPLEEQKQIVAVLDKAFAAIDLAKANIEKNLQNAKELFQSKLNEIFTQKGEGWEEVTLGEIGKVSMCKRILKRQTSTLGDIPFYKIGTFGKDPNAFISNDIYQEFKEKYSFPKKGDVLISASGTIGRRVIYDGRPAYFQDSNIVWIDNNEVLVLNEYLYQFYGVCDWSPSKGATISRLYNNDLRRIKISFPNIDEQKKLVKDMVQLSNQSQQLESKYQQKLDDLSELKKSILQKAFAGELT